MFMLVFCHRYPLTFICLCGYERTCLRLYVLCLCVEASVCVRACMWVCMCTHVDKA